MTAELDAFRSVVAGMIRRPDLDPAGVAILLVGMLDGVLLHRIVDPSTDVEAAARVLERLFAPAGGDLDDAEEKR